MLDNKLHKICEGKTKEIFVADAEKNVSFETSSFTAENNYFGTSVKL